MSEHADQIESLIEQIGELQLRNENTRFVQTEDISQLLSKLTIEPSRKRKAPTSPPRSSFPQISSHALADLTDAFSERLKIVNASHEEDDLSKMLSKLVLKHQVSQKIEDDLTKYLTKLTLRSQKRQKRQKRQSASPPSQEPLQPQAPNPKTLQTQRANKMILRKHSPIPHVIDIKKFEGLSVRSGHLIEYLAKLLDIYRRLKQQKDYKGSISPLVENTKAIAAAIPTKTIFKRLMRENESIDKAWAYILEMEDVAINITNRVDELREFMNNDIMGIYPHFKEKIAQDAYVHANNLILNNKRVFRRIFEELLPLVPKINSIQQALRS